MLDDQLPVEIRRYASGAFSPDGDEVVFELLAEGLREGVAGALVTITGIEGGAPRQLGTHMAVLADGRYCGYVSGGCVEAAVAAEAVEIISAGKDRTIRFGVNSPFLDITLPCGGGIDLHFHVGAEAEMVRLAQNCLKSREPFILRLDPLSGSSAVEKADEGARSEWVGTEFRRLYTPVTRLMLAGRGIELEELSRIACASRLDVHAFSPDAEVLDTVAGFGAKTQRLTSASNVPEMPVDAWTAAIMLFHDHDWEMEILRSFVQGSAFFIGAMGSRNTHAARRARLLEAGVPEALVARINGPIGLFGPTRDATSLSLSILAQVAQARMTYDLQ